MAKAKRDALYYIAHNLTPGSFATEKRKARSWYNVPGTLSDRQAEGNEGPGQAKTGPLVYIPSGMRSDWLAVSRGVTSSDS